MARGYDELLEEVRDRVRSLEKQLDEEKEANRENRRIIAGLVQRVPELKPAREDPPAARDGRETASEDADEVEITTVHGAAKLVA